MRGGGDDVSELRPGKKRAQPRPEPSELREREEELRSLLRRRLLRSLARSLIGSRNFTRRSLDWPGAAAT